MTDPTAESIDDKLFKTEAAKATPHSEELLLEQYKLYVGMADRISDRRQSANAFFLTINTALVAVSSYVDLGPVSHGLVAAAGVVLCYAWYRLIRSYRDLNGAKFKVIHRLEQRLPAAPYDAEWEAVGQGKRADLYLPFTHIEVAVPWIFLILHVLVLTQVIPWRMLWAVG